MDIRKVIKELQRQVDCHNKGQDFAYTMEPIKVAVPALQELQQYRQIGTVEECRAAREKQELKEVEIGKYYYWCPECGARRSIHQKHKFCHECGQAIKFTESEVNEYE